MTAASARCGAASSEAAEVAVVAVVATAVATAGAAASWLPLAAGGGAAACDGLEKPVDGALGGELVIVCVVLRLVVVWECDVWLVVALVVVLVPAAPPVPGMKAVGVGLGLGVAASAVSGMSVMLAGLMAVASPIRTNPTEARPAAPARTLMPWLVTRSASVLCWRSYERAKRSKRFVLFSR